MASSDDRIDRRKADPEILRAYQDARNERRASNYLMPMALGGKGVFFLTFLVLMALGVDGFSMAYILIGVSCAYLLTCFTLMVAWTESGKRMRTLGIIVGFLAFVSVLVAFIGTLMDRMVF